MRRSIIGLAIIGGLLCVGYLIEGMRYQLGTMARPGPGFYPLLVGSVLLIAFVGTATEVALSRTTERVEWPRGEARWRVLAIGLVSLAYSVVLPILGHPIASALVALVVLHVMDLRRWVVKVGVSAVFGIGSYYLFAVVLGVPLPVGALFG